MQSSCILETLKKRTVRFMWGTNVLHWDRGLGRVWKVSRGGKQIANNGSHNAHIADCWVHTTHTAKSKEQTAHCLMRTENWTIHISYWIHKVQKSRIAPTEMHPRCSVLCWRWESQKAVWWYCDKYHCGKLWRVLWQKDVTKAPI